jgi:hypothetical protein
MAPNLPTALRYFVQERANYHCEYCLLPEISAAHRHEPDHIVPIQHGGTTDERNLALACWRCNRYKGPNIGSFDPITGSLTAFFNPRLHQWHEHFRLHDAMIEPLTPEARVTIKILRLNDEQRLLERKRMLELGLYP